jgi:hypothetical protein
MKPILIFCLLLPFFYVKAQKSRPRLHLTSGQTYYLESNDTSTSLQSIGGRENKVNTIITLRIAFNVTGITDTLYSLEARYQSLAMKIKLADTTLNMSSEMNSKPDTPSVIMSRIVNNPFVVTITSGGKIQSIKNLDKLVTGACSDFPLVDSAKKKKVTDQFVNAFGEGSVKGLLEMGIAVFPDRPIAKYDRWMLNSVISSPASAQVHASYQLVDLTPGFYFIKGEGTIGSEKQAKPVDLNGMPATYDLNGSLLNEIKIDPKTGWIIQIKLKQLIEENIEILDNPKIPGGMTVPMMFTTGMTISGRQ